MFDTILSQEEILVNQHPTIQQLHLLEYQTLHLPAEQLPAQIGEQIWRMLDQAGKKVLITFPSPKTANAWQITAQGWVGQINLPQLTLTIAPKVPLAQVFQLWELSYDLNLAHLAKGVTAVGSMPAFFNLLAQILAQRIIHRGRQGVQRAYLWQTADLPFVRGRLLSNQSRPGVTRPTLACHFHTQTVDIPDNQILTYTLFGIARSGFCRPEVQAIVRQAFHLLQPITSLRPFQPHDCQNRTYSRLNQDYAVLHALCRFFLEHTGPQLSQGSHQLMPFLLNMAHLFERGVANWLKEHLPAPYRIRAQESTHLGSNDELHFQIDLTLYGENGRPLAVLDTKYKTPDKPSQADISQVVTYAKAKGCRHALLIYPQPLTQPLQVTIGDVELHTLDFDLEKPLEEAGKQLLAQLIKRLHL